MRDSEGLSYLLNPLTAFLDKQQVKQKKSKSANVKLGKADKAFGLGQPLYKEGLVAGATKQFDEKYGKRHTQEQKAVAARRGLAIIEAQQKAQNLGRGKRSKKAPTNLKDFEVHAGFFCRRRSP
eukprot:m.92395 g.92395  ORF g.92395 m.92395 type:complete len:124 (-) comp12035_c0_seq1:335-706(-)